MEDDISYAMPAYERQKKLLKAMDIRQIARPGSLDILASPSRIGQSLFYPNGEIRKDDPSNNPESKP